MAEKIARDMESLATRDSILRITSADYSATTPGRLSAVDGTGVVYVRPYERTCRFTANTASGSFEVRLPAAGFVAGKIYSLAATIANSKVVTVKDVTGYVTLETLDTDGDWVLLYSDGLVWRDVSLDGVA